MRIHHDKHHHAYVDNLNKAIAAEPSLAGKDLDALPPAVRTQIRNQVGGHANHSLFWTTLTPASKRKMPSGKLAAATGVPHTSPRSSTSSIGTSSRPAMRNSPADPRH